VADAPPPLLVFADDWGRHPSSCQHLVRRLLPRYPVTWVNTIMRPPRLDRDTLRRGLQKARQWLKAPGVSADAPANPRVLNPRMWPWFSSRHGRQLNRWLLARQLRPVILRMPVPPVVVTTLPIVAGLAGAIPASRWVYYCVDDFSLWPGLDGVALRRMEEQLVGEADEVIAVSTTLRDKLARMGRTARLLTHGVDTEFWGGAGDGVGSEATGSARPLVVFWGVIDRRMDVAFVSRLAHDLTEGTIVLAGPLDNPDPVLLRLPRVAHLGALPFERLPALAREASVLVMPYADLPVTRAMQPLKLKEYLATGRPVVARDLPATRGWGDCLDLAASPEAFSQAVRCRLHSGVPAEQRAARRRLAGESWDDKAGEFESCLRRSPEPAFA
jgi:glycosyltransferase involved in cell wall biosynthesis